MLEVSQEIKELLKQDNRTEETQRNIKLTFYDDSIDSLYPSETLFPDIDLFPANFGESWLEIPGEQIVAESLVLEEGLCSDEYLRFGACEATKFELMAVDVKDDIKGHWFVAELMVGSYKMAFGIYRVEDVEIQKDKRFKKIIAYDRMCLFDIDVSKWYNNLKFPMTLREFRQSLANHVGVSVDQTNLPNDAMILTKTIEASNLKGRTVLEYICEINGVFGHFDRTGVLKFISLGYGGLYPDEELFPQQTGVYPGESSEPEQIAAQYKSLDYKEWFVESIDRLEIIGENGASVAFFGDGENTYYIKGNPLVYGKEADSLLEAARNAYGNMNGRTYVPSVVEIQALPYVEVGDLLKVQYSGGSLDTFVMKRTSKGIQAMMDVFESAGDKLQSQSFGIREEIQQMKSTAYQTRVQVSTIDENLGQLDSYTKDNFTATNKTIGEEITRAKSVEQNIQTAVSQNAQNIQNETARAIKNEETLSASLKVTAENIVSEVSRAKDAENYLKSTITQTASSITSTVERKTTELDQKMNRTTTTLRSEIKQTAESITSTMSKEVNGIQVSMSKIEQTADKIKWLVKSGTSESNFTMTDRAMKLVAESIDLTGFVTFSALSGNGTTTINGSNIKTGIIDASKVTVKNLNADNITSGHIDVSLVTAGGHPVITKGYSGITIGNFFDYTYVQGKRVVLGISSGQIGFFGHTPAARQQVVAPSSANMVYASLTRLISALKAYGLIY